MIYDFIRFISGPYLNGVIDFYVAHQQIFNTLVVVLGFAWIVYCRNKNKGKKTVKRNFFGMEVK